MTTITTTTVTTAAAASYMGCLHPNNRLLMIIAYLFYILVSFILIISVHSCL